MRLALSLTAIVLAILLLGVPRSFSRSKSVTAPRWQKVDQLCGTLELSAPARKTIVVDGKRETRLYTTVVKQAEITLYPASSRVKVCLSGKPLATTRSNRYGAFIISGI